MSAATTSSLADRLVPTGIAGAIALVVYAAWRGTVPYPSLEERRADAPQRVWTMSCATCHGLDGLGITGRGGDVTRTDHRETAALRRLLDGPAHPRAARAISDRQVEQVAEHLRLLRIVGAP